MAEELKSCSDEELARQSQTGSLAAFEELVRRYEHRVYAFACQLCPGEVDARELTQDAFVQAFLSLRQFDSRRSFAPWLFTIARRKGIDRHRHRSTLRWTDEAAPELPDVRDPAALLEESELRRDLWQRARRCLPPVQFQALWLRYAEDMEVADIARVLGKSRVHAKVLLFRARRALLRELSPVQMATKAKAASRPNPEARAGSALKFFCLLML